MWTALRYLAASLCFVLAALSAARATTLVDPGIEGLARHSERVVVARVTGQSVWAERAGASTRIFTDTTLTVSQTLWGPVDVAPLTLRQPGGTAWLAGVAHHHRVDGAARFAPGEQVLVFLERAGDGRLVVTGMELGKFTLSPDPATGEMIATRAAGHDATAHTLSPPTGAAEPAPVRLARPESRGRFPLTALLARIRGAVGDRVVTPSATVRP